ncbi:MAG: chorismate mutase [Candidatus Marinimicrobia bacterium]|nr:chorismate mutase [Candidatus Neomarinimicrobiota bacterium]
MSDNQFALDRIKDCREKIDIIDEQLLTLLVERMDIAVEVGTLKQTIDMVVKDPNREQEIIDRLSTLTNNPLSRNHINKIFKEIFRAARDVQ